MYAYVLCCVPDQQEWISSVSIRSLIHLYAASNAAAAAAAAASGADWKMWGKLSPSALYAVAPAANFLLHPCREAYKSAAAAI